MRFILAIILVFITSFSYAKEEKDNELFMQKFGRKGLEQLAYFKELENRTLKPYATEIDEYEIDQNIQDIDYKELTPVAIPKNDRCKSYGTVSLNSQLKKYFYKSNYNSKSYNLRIETTFCSTEKVNINKNTFSGQIDGESGFTKLIFYKNDKKILKLDMWDDSFNLYINGQYLLLDVDQGCCDPGHHYYYYDWINEKILDDKALSLGIEDAPTADEDNDITHMIMPDGQSVCDYAMKEVKGGDIEKECLKKSRIKQLKAEQANDRN